MTTQTKAAKLRQREADKLRAQQASAAATTVEQSQVTKKPPTLYSPPKITQSRDVGNLWKIVNNELISIAHSQSIILTLWQQLQDNAETVEKLKGELNELKQALEAKQQN